MEIFICQSCGTILRNKSKNCASCGTSISRFTSTVLASVSQASAPLTVDVRPDPLILERMVAKRQLALLDNGNGHGDNSDNGDSSPPRYYGGGGILTGLRLPGAPILRSNPWDPLPEEEAASRPAAAEPEPPAPPPEEVRAPSPFGSSGTIIGSIQSPFGSVLPSPDSFSQPSALDPLPQPTLVPQPDPLPAYPQDASYPSAHSSYSPNSPNSPDPPNPPDPSIAPIGSSDSSSSNSAPAEDPPSPWSAPAMPSSGLPSTFLPGSGSGLASVFGGHSALGGGLQSRFVGSSHLGGIGGSFASMPAPEPEPVPAPVPIPEPVLASEPEPEPVPAPVPEPAPQPEPEPPLSAVGQSTFSSGFSGGFSPGGFSSGIGGGFSPGGFSSGIPSNFVPAAASPSTSSFFDTPASPPTEPSPPPPPETPLMTDDIYPTAQQKEQQDVQGEVGIGDVIGGAAIAAAVGFTAGAVFGTNMGSSQSGPFGEVAGGSPEGTPAAPAIPSGVDPLASMSLPPADAGLPVNVMPQEQESPPEPPAPFAAPEAQAEPQAAMSPVEAALAEAMGSSPEQQQPVAEHAPSASSQPAPPPSDAMDFFATKPAAASKSSMPSAPGAGAMDFFSTAPIPKPRSEEVPRPPEDQFPDESVNRDDRDEGSSAAAKAAAVSGAEDERPKVAPPKGYTPKDTSETNKPESAKPPFPQKKAADDDDDDDDDDDKKKKKSSEPPPARRSFSGKGSSVKADSKLRKSESSEEGEEAEEEREEGEVFGMPKKKAALVAAIVLSVGIVVLNMMWTVAVNLAGNVGGLVPSVPGMQQQQQQQQQQQIGLGGIWTIEAKTRNDPRVAAGKMMLKQDGPRLMGQGEDNFGPFLVQGEVRPPDRVQFNKAYIVNGKPATKPIEYFGKFGVGQDSSMQMLGIYRFMKKQGVFLHLKMVEQRGDWRARQIAGEGVVANAQPMQNMPAQNVPQNNMQMPNMHMPSMPMSPNQPSLDGKSQIQKQQEFFLMIALGFIAFGVVICVVFLYIFGPSGKLNILAKQEYIPSQFKAQHFKMVNEWAKPLKPGGVPLGTRCEWRFWKFWTPRTMSMTPASRSNNPHFLVIGGGDKGKSRLIASYVTHDIESADRAIVVIDSDGGLVDLVTKWVAANPKGKEYAKRIVVVDPTYRGGSLAYNPLEVPDDGDLQSAASSIVHGFKAIYTEPPGAQSQWNQQTANILRNAALLLMANNKTLTDLPTLLQDNDFRDILLEGVEKKKRERVEYGTLLETWGQYKRLARTDQWINWVEPILNRVTPMLSDPRIRPILTKPVGDLKLREVIQQRKILLVKIPQGQLDQNANLLGSLLVTGLKQAALSRSIENINRNEPVALYLDEFDNFIEKETIEALTQETRKFQIGFVGCCKTLQHLPEDFRNQIIINVGTMMIFALAKKDGDMLGPQMFRVDGRKIKHQTIQNFFNKVNTSPAFELISDEEKLNIDRVVGQEERTFFCYRVGTVAGVFNLRSHDFPDVAEKNVKTKLIEKMHGMSKEEATTPAAEVARH